MLINKTDSVFIIVHGMFLKLNQRLYGLQEK